jgi:aminoglycoside 6'-N-acetyltransferase
MGPRVRGDDAKNHPYRDQPPGTRGIDQFIGEPELIGRGIGSRFVRAFARELLGRGTPRVVTDPHPANTVAIRAYMKAGFHTIGPRETLWGPVRLMACEPRQATDPA